MNFKKLIAAKKVADSKRRIADVKFDDNAIHDNSTGDLLQFLFNNLKDIDWNAAVTWFSDSLEAGDLDSDFFKDRLCSFIIHNFTQSDKREIIEQSGLKFGERK